MKRVEKGAGLIGQQRVDRHEAGDRFEIILDEIDASGNRGQAEVQRHEHDEQQAPPEDRHGIADRRNGHQRLIEIAAALDRGDRARRHADERARTSSQRTRVRPSRETASGIRSALFAASKATCRNRHAAIARHRREIVSRPAGRVRARAGTSPAVREKCRARRRALRQGRRGQGGLQRKSRTSTRQKSGSSIRYDELGKQS